MSSHEDDILNQLIDIWMKVSNQVGIRWSICAGTYIGLIRNKGRIPWDDDFDVTIMKEDLPKLKNIDQLFSKYNVSFVSFWGGYKIFFNDYRGVKKFPQYGWNWPFIDIFATEKDINNRAKMECFFLQKEQLKQIIREELKRMEEAYVQMSNSEIASVLAFEAATAVANKTTAENELSMLTRTQRSELHEEIRVFVTDAIMKRMRARQED